MNMNLNALRDELVRDEGLRLTPYHCTAGRLTIGVGRNIEERGISRDEAMAMLDNDIAAVSAELDRAAPWWSGLSDGRRRALINMAVNMGVPRLLGFRRMLAALRAGDFPQAAAEALDSKWAADVGPGRSGRIAQMIKEAEAMGIPIIDGLLGIGKVVADRLIPDRNKAQDQAHERAVKQTDVTAEGERARNYWTPRAIVMYAMAFAVIYGVVIRPFGVALGLALPEVDISAPMRLLLGLLGLEFTG